MAAFTFDELLVRRLMDGDRDALGELYDANAAAAYTLALSMCGSPGEAAEAVRRTFVELWDGRAGLFPGEREFTLHFYAALRRHCRALRAGMGRTMPAGRLGEETGGGLLAGLPPVEREALALVILRGYDEREASQVIGATPSRVRALVRRGLERLSERMGEEVGAG